MQETTTAADGGGVASERKFHIGDVLSVITGYLVSPGGIGDIYEILNHMAGERLFTHQLPRVSREAAPLLLARYPRLADVDASGSAPENISGRLKEWAAIYGEMLAVPTMTSSQHERIDALSELAERVHASRIFVVAPEKDTAP